jgi:hypothetical protein
MQRSPLARRISWNISLDTPMGCSYTRVICSFLTTAIIVSNAGPEGKRSSCGSLVVLRPRRGSGVGGGIVTYVQALARRVAHV